MFCRYRFVNQFIDVSKIWRHLGISIEVDNLQVVLEQERPFVGRQCSRLGGFTIQMLNSML